MKKYHKTYHNRQVDIFWMESNSTHVWSEYEKVYHRVDTIYPLAERPFSGRMMLGPRDPWRAIDEEYGAWVLGKRRWLKLCERLQFFCHCEDTNKINKLIIKRS